MTGLCHQPSLFKRLSCRAMQDIIPLTRGGLLRLLMEVASEYLWPCPWSMETPHGVRIPLEASEIVRTPARGDPRGGAESAVGWSECRLWSGLAVQCGLRPCASRSEHACRSSAAVEASAETPGHLRATSMRATGDVAIIPHRRISGGTHRRPRRSCPSILGSIPGDGATACAPLDNAIHAH
jgi:hypothetical protein